MAGDEAIACITLEYSTPAPLRHRPDEFADKTNPPSDTERGKTSRPEYGTVQ